MSAVEIAVGITGVVLAILIGSEFIVQGKIHGWNMIALIISFGIAVWFVARIAGAV